MVSFCLCGSNTVRGSITRTSYLAMQILECMNCDLMVREAFVVPVKVKKGKWAWRK